MTVIHVYPSDDPRPHHVSLEAPCWCAVRVNDEDDGQTHIHAPSIPLLAVEREEELPVPLVLRNHPAYVGRSTIKRMVKVPNLRIITAVLQGSRITETQLPSRIGHAN